MVQSQQGYLGLPEKLLMRKGKGITERGPGNDGGQETVEVFTRASPQWRFPSPQHDKQGGSSGSLDPHMLLQQHGPAIPSTLHSTPPATPRKREPGGHRPASCRPRTAGQLSHTCFIFLRLFISAGMK